MSKISKSRQVRDYVFYQRGIFTSADISDATGLDTPFILKRLHELKREGKVKRLPVGGGVAVYIRVKEAVPAYPICVGRSKRGYQCASSSGTGRRQYDWKPQRDVLECVWQACPPGEWLTAKEVIRRSGLTAKRSQRTLYRYLQTAVYLGCLLVLKAGLCPRDYRFMYSRGLRPEGLDIPSYSAVRVAFEDIDARKEFCNA